MFIIVAAVECETAEQAAQVLAERLGPDEDYGFPYTIRHTALYQAETFRQSKLGGTLNLSLKGGRTILA